MCSLGKILLAFLYSKAKLACYSKYLLTSYFFIPVPYDEKGIFVVLALEGLLFPSSILDTHWPGGFILWCHMF